jgi:Ankyrin repeats (3 copies)
LCTDSNTMFPHEDELRQRAVPAPSQQQRPAPPVKEIVQHHHRHQHRGGRSLLDLERTTTASTASSEEDDDDSSFGGWNDDGHDEMYQQSQQQQHQHHHHQQQQQQLQLQLQQQQQQQQHLINQQLINATLQGKTEKVQRLLLVDNTQHVNVNATDERYGATALHYACIGAAEDDAVELVQLLLHHGANVHAKQRKGNDTALHHACAKNHVNVAHLLLKHGASITVQNEAGQTPVDVAATDAMATTLRNYRRPGSELSPGQRDKIVTGKKEQRQQPNQQQKSTLVVPEKVAVAQKRGLFLDKPPQEKIQQQQQQAQRRDLNHTSKRRPTTFLTKKLQDQHQADMAALQDIVKTVQLSINQCKQEQQQQQEFISSGRSIRQRNIAEMDADDVNEAGMLQQSLQVEIAALRQTVAALQMENASLQEKFSLLESSKLQSQQQQQQGPTANNGDSSTISKSKSKKHQSTIFRENPTIATATTAENGNINSSSSTVSERMEAMQDTIECYKLEMACLQEQLRASQRQQQQQHHDHQRSRRHHVQTPLHPVDHRRGFSSSSFNNTKRHDTDRTTTTTTEQDLQNILTDLLALTRRYMEERDNCQN